MKEKLEALLKEGTAKIEAAQSEAELQEVKGALLGKQGSITELLKEIPKLDVALRPEMGKAVNNVKSLLSEQIEGRREALKLKASDRGQTRGSQAQGVRGPRRLRLHYPRL